MSLEHEHAGEAAHPDDPSETRFQGVGRAHGQGCEQYLAATETTAGFQGLMPVGWCFCHESPTEPRQIRDLKSTERRTLQKRHGELYARHATFVMSELIEEGISRYKLKTQLEFARCEGELLCRRAGPGCACCGLGLCLQA